MFSFFSPNIKPIQRNFNPAYLLDKSQQEQFEREGYVLIRDVYTKEEIDKIISFYNEIKTNKDFNVQSKFESSGNFSSIELQNKIFQYIEHLMKNTAVRYANLDNCEIGDGGAFFIKPNTEESRLEPHQDSTVIDESVSYGMFVWIPLIDINETNGALYVLPKSHLWGNHYRSQHITWAFKKSFKKLWKYMMPIYMNKGDILIFDTSIIHASEKNNSLSERIALCGALLPKDHQKVDYLSANKRIMQYLVDENYWRDGGLATSLSKYPYKIIDNKFPKSINKYTLKKLVKESNNESI